ncbi:hypothetical protein [Lampropedia cohaerens]|uniref:hypothetical protein n=1 Tax=Lampropedia cohaerens TaxID=1610491 RepID=UPI0012E354A5|nr:hypothetical protein [Lampropedia cohaerens]
MRLIVFAALLLTACGGASNLAPVAPIPKAENSDLGGMADCAIINANIDEARENLGRYKKSKTLNSSANILSGLASIISLGMQSADYVSNDDLNASIQSYEKRLVALHNLQQKHCSQ